MAHRTGVLPAQRLWLASALVFFVLLALSGAIAVHLTPARAISAQAPQAGATIAIQGFSFSPVSVTIQVGETVTWTNGSSFHNVLADDGSFTSGPLGTEWTTFSHTFDTVGEFGYFCEAHGAAGGSGMAGKVFVVGPQTTPQMYLPLLSH